MKLIFLTIINCLYKTSQKKVTILFHPVEKIKTTINNFYSIIGFDQLASITAKHRIIIKIYKLDQNLLPLSTVATLSAAPKLT